MSKSQFIKCYFSLFYHPINSLFLNKLKLSNKSFSKSNSENLQDKLDDFHVISTENKQVKEGYSGQKSKKTTLDYVDSEFVASLEDLAPLAIDKVEALSIEGLRIQCGMSNEEAPSNINAHTIGEVSTLESKKVTSIGSIGLEGALGLKLLALEDTETHVNDELMGLSLTIDEWMKLDSGEINEDECLSERILKLLAAHHAKTTNPIFLKNGSGRGCGLLGNKLTISMMVQLCDPLRNYDPVGTPMLALIQVERVFVPSKHIENDLDLEAKHEKECLISRYKTTEVHVSGFKTGPNKKRLWGSDAEQQSGSHWLLANGMGKVSKTPFLKPGIVVKSSFPATITSNTLWSISARVHGSGYQLKELGPHIRNPNVIISNESIKLR